MMRDKAPRIWLRGMFFVSTNQQQTEGVVMNQIVPVEPKRKMFRMPVWWHHHGTKLRPDKSGFDGRNKTLTLKASAAEVLIQAAADGGGWRIDYEIRHSSDTLITGRLWMSDANLRTAFGLSNECEAEFGQCIIDAHGGDVACQGRYIRCGNWLNLPGPGTGHDGDANVSILLDEEIKEAIGKLTS